MTTVRFLKLLFWVNGAVPGAMLIWDATGGRLGANPVNDAIRTTGLIALTFLMLSLLVTPLRQLTGWNQLIAARRVLGLWGFYYACVHLSLYVGLDRALDMGSTLQEILTRRYLQVGIGAVILMIPLALTSTDALVRRLGARKWKLLHRLAYVAIAGGVLHYYLLVKSDVRQPLAFAGVYGLLMVARGGRHYWDLRQAAHRAVAAPKATASTKKSFWKGELIVARTFDETPEVRTFRLIPPGGGPLPFNHQPGQYLTLQQQVGDRRVMRCYTIASPPTRPGYCEISVKREAAGLSSGRLHDQVREGDRLMIGAPAGKFVFTGIEADKVVLIAGGVGITPLMSIARHLTDTCWQGKIDFIIAARTRPGIIFHDELRMLALRFPNLRVHTILSTAADDAQWSGERGHLSRAVLERWIPDWRTPHVYVCGPTPMMDAVTSLLRQMGVDGARIHTEAFVSSAVLDAEAPADGESRGTALGNAAPVEAAIHFLPSDKRFIATPGQTVLEAAEDAGAEIPFECRSGVCGQCKVRLTKGRVAMDAEDALSTSEKRGGYILACQSHALEDLTIEV